VEVSTRERFHSDLDMAGGVGGGGGPPPTPPHPSSANDIARDHSLTR
jgi:hypothetical protein